LAAGSADQDFPEATFAPSAREALRQSLTAENIAQEAAYLRAEGRASFERPYGLAWLFQLVAELREWDDPQAREMGCELASAGRGCIGTAEGLASQAFVSRANRRAFADRFCSGPNARLCTGNGNRGFADLLVSKARQFYLGDKSCPLEYEPSGEDFLSPCLGEADLMRRVLPSPEFGHWLRSFLPQISPARNGAWLQPVVSPDPSDPKLAHLDGLNLSRAWMLEGIAAGLHEGDKRLPRILAVAEQHKRAGLAAVTGKHYEGGHWLGSFAVYLVTSRGTSQKWRR